MKRQVTRRDFLNGIAVGVGASMVPEGLARAMDPHLAFSEDYPPAKVGLRGSHEGSYEVAHSLRDGGALPPAEDTGELYDLAVVGGGISGLSAAYFYRQAAGSGSKILVLDNHDDFGGHAKRNEFTVGDKQLIGYGGTMLIEAPGGYPAVAKRLLRELGIDTDRFKQAYHHDLFDDLGLASATFFNRERFGRDHLAVGSLADAKVVAGAPLSDGAKAQLVRLFANERHYLDEELGRDAQLAYLTEVSYETYLRERAQIGAEALAAIKDISRGVWAIGIDAFPARAAMVSGYPGFGELDLGLYSDSAEAEEDPHPYIYHFPDGNATIARMLVREMIPKVAPGRTMDDIVLAKFNYGALDRAANKVRIRLNSTVVRVRHIDDDLDNAVRVTYVVGGKARTVTARQVVLACYHGIVPRLCPQMPNPQRELLGQAVRAPLVYTNVVVRNWQSIANLGFHRALCSGSFFHNVMLDWPVSIGGYDYPVSPEEPMVLHLNHVPGEAGLSAREQFRAGQRSLLSTPFGTFEDHVRDQLTRMLAPGGFQADRDIAAITVNRWPHGYAYAHDPKTDRIAFEPDLWSPEERYWERNRDAFGNIAIAASDAASNAMSEAAIEQAYRAVSDLTS
ncbi:MAG: NAD(P)-binding protein [Pseudomonadota bacterium]